MGKEYVKCEMIDMAYVQLLDRMGKSNALDDGYTAK